MDEINARYIVDTKTHTKQTVVSIQNKNENYYYCQSNFK